jgi:hypothetical protein
MVEREWSSESLAWHDPIGPTVAFAAAALVLALVGWDGAAAVAFGALAGYSLSGSV